ncbi:MAG: ATP-dependent protease ATPase subunit HslU [Pseudomonadales bacterium]|jgi:ATP-dependent HslUV protease ATP-binding subunit HslU|nr:ATP-dependent protease ATPase subunit HslU [Pseudomonadales bacterium]MBL6807727.1 ATP-dependent protease ATPase subunit HslU [Pseudomonadales bacterium]MDA0954697.1 ATP-dependent protease ATPase subunit HslU [Pseudomonadota bacterium]
MTEMTPREIVHALDQHIVGQSDAKRAVAIALRNRWRRLQLSPTLREEVTPKNILMIGPTGVGKTEIARRLAKLARAPFLKVEATKFTEVGYVGRDVDAMIRDLAEAAYTLLRKEALEAQRPRAQDAAEQRLLDALLPPARGEEAPQSESSARQLLRKQLREGKLDKKEVSLELAAPQAGPEIMTPPGMEEMASQLQGLFAGLQQGRRRSERLPVAVALKRLEEEEAGRLLNEDQLRTATVDAVQNRGIVFIDEIDKVARRGDGAQTDVSREGVQRDLLPLIEGSTVTTKYGPVRTDHILFIASGAFHLARPSDLIPELQGRLPIRVELKALTPEDFRRILTEPSASLLRQYEALLATEGVTLELTDEALTRLAELAWQINERTENIGARRLHTMLERLLEPAAFDPMAAAPDGKLIIDAAAVDRQLGEAAGNEDLARYIL